MYLLIDIEYFLFIVVSIVMFTGGQKIKDFFSDTALFYAVFLVCLVIGMV